MGLGATVGALSFLANDCALVHGAVCMAAVAVTQTLDWKLHGFDVMSDHQFASQYDLPLTAAAWLVPQQFKPGEVAKGDWQVRLAGERHSPCCRGLAANRRHSPSLLFDWCVLLIRSGRERRPGLGSGCLGPGLPHAGGLQRQPTGADRGPPQHRWVSPAGPFAHEQARGCVCVCVCALELYLMNRLPLALQIASPRT